MSFQFIYLIIFFLYINSNIALSQVEIVGDQNFTIVQNDDSINMPFFQMKISIIQMKVSIEQ